MSDHGSAIPRKHLALLTCGHSDVDAPGSLAELGYQPGDFHTIAFDCESMADDIMVGAAIQLKKSLVDDGGDAPALGVAIDSVWRSLALSQYALGTREITILLGLHCAGGQPGVLAPLLLNMVKESPYLHKETRFSDAHAYLQGSSGTSPLSLKQSKEELRPQGILHAAVGDFMLTCMDARIADGNERNAGAIADPASVRAAVRALRNGGRLRIRPHTGCGVGAPHTDDEYNQLISQPLGLPNRNWGTFADPVQAAIDSKPIFQRAFDRVSLQVDIQLGVYLVDKGESVWLPFGVESAEAARRQMAELG